MNITFISTVNHNIGDDFVRTGIMFLINSIHKKKINYYTIHKHSPITTRIYFEFLRDNRIGRRIDRILPLIKKWDKIFKSDIIIQSGAPVIWCDPNTVGHCAENEWYEPLIERRYTLTENKKLFNIAAGTCLPYNSKGEEILNCDIDKNYLKKFYELTDLTTVRDKLSSNIYNKLGCYPEMLPCTSLFANDYFSIQAQKGKYIVFNFMENAAHYTLGQNINKSSWVQNAKKIYNELKKIDKVILSCHNNSEVILAKKIFGDNIELFYSNYFKDYIQFYSRASAGILNRVHGGYILASLGKPAIIIGNDSRSRMIENLELPSYYVNDVDVERVIDKFKTLYYNQNQFSENMENLKQVTMDKYTNLFNEFI